MINKNIIEDLTKISKFKITNDEEQYIITKIEKMLYNCKNLKNIEI